MSSKLQSASGTNSTQSAAIDPETAWQQILSRDAAAAFFYAVTTTGVFCRPSCSSRRPLKANVRFFRSTEEARAAGFRPCKRCKPGAAHSSPLDEVRAYIEANLDRSIPLAELGRLVRLSPFTVQRLFKQKLGVSPLQYSARAACRPLRTALKQGGTVTNAIYNAGFGSSSRAYEGSQLGMTPARFAQAVEASRSASPPLARPSAGWWSAQPSAGYAGWPSVPLRRGRGQPARGVSAGDTAPRSVALALVDAAASGAGSDRLASCVTTESAWTCAEPSSSSASGRLCAPFPAAKPALTASWHATWASPGHPRRRPRLRHQPRRHCCALPSRCGCQRLAHRLSLGRGPEADTAGGGELAGPLICHCRRVICRNATGDDPSRNGQRV